MAFSRGENRYPDAEGYTYCAGDITDYKQLKVVFEEFHPTAVINAAAMTQVDACESSPEVCNAINTKAVHHLAGLCKEYNSRLIQLSTDFVFDGLAGPYREGDTPAPISTYGRSKLEAEKIVEAADIPAAIVRTVLVYGVVPDLSRSNIVLWVKNSLEGGKPIKVVNDQFRSPTLAEDLADGVLAVLFRNKTGIYHISGSELLSVYDIAQRVADFFKLDRGLISPTDSGSLGQAAKRPPKTGFVILKAQTELDYYPQDLTTGLQLVQRQLEALENE